jgi:pimeloyl-ACP methyl ester carboxylesterase
VGATFTDFLLLSPEDGLTFVKESDEHADIVREGMGPRAFQEFVALTGKTPVGGHLAITRDTNMLFLPGIMGSSLGSEELGGIWWLDPTNPTAINKLGLSADGLTDAEPGSEIVPLTTDHRYTGFLAACRDESALSHDRLPYDWRKSLRLSADAVRERIVAIQKRNGLQSVHVVAHSMGGALIRVALMLHGDELWPRVGRIVFLGTPHYGSPAIGGYLKNHFWGFNMMVVLAKLLERSTFRSMRGALGLLPAPIGVYPGTRNGEEHPCANFDLYDASAWHLDLDADETGRLQSVLDDAAQLHRELYESHNQLPQERRDRMAVIAGVGYDTLFRLEYGKRLYRWEHMKKITKQDQWNPDRLGDGRVPLPSATLEHIGETRYVHGVHGSLPNIPAVYRDAFRWLKGEPMALPTTPVGALSRHLSTSEDESRTPTLDGSILATHDNPGYLDLAPVTDEQATRLVEQVEHGQSPEFRSISIL